MTQVLEKPKHAGGRPLKFQNVEELQLRINNYFETTPQTEWTWSGLALFLDVERETLKSYRDRQEFSAPLKRALAKIEVEYEKENRKHGRAGSIFALKNFGWSDQQQVEHTHFFPMPLLDNTTKDVLGNHSDKESTIIEQKD